MRANLLHTALQTLLRESKRGAYTAYFSSRTRKVKPSARDQLVRAAFTSSRLVGDPNRHQGHRGNHASRDGFCIRHTDGKTKETLHHFLAIRKYLYEDSM